MTTDQQPSTARTCFGMCLLMLVFLSLPLIYFQIKPHLKHTCPIEVRVLDSEGHPIVGAEVQYIEGDIAPWIPIMLFGPARKIRHDGSAITDSSGLAKFRIKHDAYISAVKLEGRKRVVHHTTTKSWSGHSSTSDSMNGARWVPAPTPTQIQTTEIVLAETP